MCANMQVPPKTSNISSPLELELYRWFGSAWQICLADPVRECALNRSAVSSLIFILTV